MSTSKRKMGKSSAESINHDIPTGLAGLAYAKALDLAQTIIAIPYKILRLVSKSRRKVASSLSQVGEVALNQTRTSLRLLQAYANGQYQQISVGNALLLVASMAYLVSSIDVIPDFILTIGLTDDIALLVWTFTQLKDELARFKAWETDKKGTGQVIDGAEYSAL